MTCKWENLIFFSSWLVSTVIATCVVKLKQPHIIFMVLDDLGWHDVGFNGLNEIPTPNIDALAYSGVILNRHYVLPTCTPTRSALLTGKHPITLGMLTELDFSVGRIVRALHETNILEDTIIVFLSDNGAQSISIPFFLQPNWGSNFPLRGIKSTQYDGGVRCPALVWSPRLPRGVVYDGFMHVTDWLPTLVNTAGGNMSDIADVETDGEDMWSKFRTSTKTNRTFLVNIDEVERVEAVIMDSRWKAIRGGMRDYAMFDGHTGEVNTAAKYNAKAVRNSYAGKAILNTNGYQGSLDAPKITILRGEAKVRCRQNCPERSAGPQFGYVNASRAFYCPEMCVFDLLNDPCECDPLVPAVGLKQRAERLLQEYRQVLVPQTNTQIDPAANPDRFGGVWRPWLNSIT